MFKKENNDLAYFEECIDLEKMDQDDIDDLIDGLDADGVLIHEGNRIYLDTGKHHEGILSLLERSRRGLDNLQDIDEKTGLSKEDIIDVHSFDFEELFERTSYYISAIENQFFFVKDPDHVAILSEKLTDAVEILKKIFDHRLYIRTQMMDVVKKNTTNGQNGRQSGVVRDLHFDPEPLG
jgi:hypothetical protein